MFAKILSQLMRNLNKIIDLGCGQANQIIFHKMPKKFKCCLGCRTNASAFCFPEEEQRRRQWFKAINMEYSIKTMHLCGRHFSSRHYSNRYLRRNAIPDINLEPIKECPMNLEDNVTNTANSADVKQYLSTEKQLSVSLSTDGEGTEFLTAHNQNNAVEGGSSVKSLKKSQASVKAPRATLEMKLRTKEFQKMETQVKLPTYKNYTEAQETNWKTQAEILCKTVEAKLNASFENEVKENVQTKVENANKKRKTNSRNTLQPICSSVLTCVTEASQTGFDGFETCGLIQRSTKDNKFFMTCFHCTAEYEASDWEDYIMHFNNEHIFEIEPKISKPKKSPRTRKRILKPKLADTTETTEIVNCITEASQTGFLDACPVEASNENCIKNSDYGNDDEISESRANNEDSIQNAAVINFYYSDHARILKFLETLRTHPLLWHPRRYGPALFDEEAEKFLNDLNDSLAMEDLRSSLENARKFQRRFNPLTAAKKLQLENEPQLQEYLNQLNEIATLGQSYAYNCDCCSFYFLDENQLYKHKVVRHQIGDINHICSCGQYFANINEKEEHEIAHSSGPNYKCQHCELVFFSDKKLQKHVVLYHPDAVPNAQPYQCTLCDERFAQQYMLKWHLSKHEPPRYKCEICGKSYRKAPQYDRHMKKHLDQRDFMCEQCGKAFLSKHHLKRHRLDVHKLGEHFCEHCKHSFASYENLYMHKQKIHPNGTNLDHKKKQHAMHMKRYFQRLKAAKPPKGTRKQRELKCKECGLRFDRMRELRQHKREYGHTLGDRPYKCPHCDSILNSVLCFLNHLRKMHQLPVKYADIKYYKPYTEGDGNEVENVDEVYEGANFDDVIAYEEVDEAVQNLDTHDSEIVNVEFFEEYHGV